MHLLLPLLASLLFVFGLIFVKRAGALGVRPVTALFLSNQCSAALFSILWFWGGPGQPWWMLWQPALIATLFIVGLAFTFMSLELGDVSIATPVLGLKVVMVALLLTVMGVESLPRGVWYAAVMSTLGIGLIQWTGRAQPRRMVMTIVFALLAGVSYAAFDVLVQRWSPAWGSGRFLPIVYWFVGLASLCMLPWVDWSFLKQGEIRRNLVPGAILIAMQAICIVLALSVFGDAARVNVVYALRGLWGVLVAWLVARRWGGAEAEMSRSVLVTRLAGASLLTAAVVLVISRG